MSEEIKDMIEPIPNWKYTYRYESSRTCGKLYIQSLLEEKDKEIERLNKRIEDLNIINEEHKTLNGMIRKELQQKENIIKEVREYIEDNSKEGPIKCKRYFYSPEQANDILEILDKVD